MAAVTNVGRDEWLKFLEPVVEPAAEIIQEGAGTADDGSHFPRIFVSFQAHMESGKLVGVGVDDTLEVDHFSLG